MSRSPTGHGFWMPASTGGDECPGTGGDSPQASAWQAPCAPCAELQAEVCHTAACSHLLCTARMELELGDACRTQPALGHHSRALSCQPLLLLTTCLTARLGFNKFNGVASRQGAAREPLLAGCDNARVSGAKRNSRRPHRLTAAPPQTSRVSAIAHSMVATSVGARMGVSARCCCLAVTCGPAPISTT
jgi:hypothetical protein